MKKSFSLATFLSLLSTSLFAQIGGIEDSVADISDTIRNIFPIILGVIFLVGFLFNAGLYIGLHRISRLLEFLRMTGAFPKIISNKRNSSIDYEKD